MFPGWFGLVDVLSICCVEETNGVVDERSCPFVIIVFSFVSLVLIDGPSVLVTVGVDVDEVVVDFVILGVFVTWLLVFPLGFTEDPLVVVTVRSDVVVVPDSVEMFDSVVLFASITVDCVVGIFVAVETSFVVIRVVDGLIDETAADLLALEILGFGDVDDVNVASVVELSVVLIVVGLLVSGVAEVLVVSAAVVVFVVGFEDDDNDEDDVFNTVVDFVVGMLVLVDVCMGVPVKELDVDAGDNDVVDWEGAPVVIEAVSVAYKRNHLLCKFEF